MEMVEQQQLGGIDLTGRYALRSGARVIPRAPDAVQIGTEPPRCLMLLDAPEEALHLLHSLDGGSSLNTVLLEHEADPDVWGGLLSGLLEAELLIPVTAEQRGRPAFSAAHLMGERAALVHRLGPPEADRILQARQDAIVVIHGPIAVTGAMAVRVAAAGVGHVHLEPDGSAGQSSARSPVTATGALRDRFPTVRVHAPAAHQPPTVAVMFGGPVPDLGLAATYTRRRVPHLSVTSWTARIVVGPLVLPGRSSCLSCADRYRIDRDPGWPDVARDLIHLPPRPPAVLGGAAVLAASTALLDYIDGVDIPTTVNGTLEWEAGSPTPRRRSWTLHPRCGCRG